MIERLFEVARNIGHSTVPTKYIFYDFPCKATPFLTFFQVNSMNLVLFYVSFQEADSTSNKMSTLK